MLLSAVSWLASQGFVNVSHWRWYIIVIWGGETRVGRLGRGEATGHDSCLACLRRCLLAYDVIRIGDGVLRIGAVVAAEHAICS